MATVKAEKAERDRIAAAVFAALAGNAGSEQASAYAGSLAKTAIELANAFVWEAREAPIERPFKGKISLAGIGLRKRRRAKK
jgi:hypothetical protein